MDFRRTKETVLSSVGVFIKGEAMDDILKILVGSEAMNDRVHIRFIRIISIHSMKSANVLVGRFIGRFTLPWVLVRGIASRSKF